MRVLHVMAGAEHGGAETACIDMCELMAAKGLDIRVAARPNKMRGERLKKLGIQVYDLPFGSAIDVYTPYRIARIIRDYRPDIVQTWLSRAAARIPPRKIVGTDKDYRVVSRLGGYYKLKYFKNTDRFITITPDIRRHLIDHGVDPGKVVHINNFAETETVETPLSRADLETPENAAVVVCLGRLHTAKAYDVLMQAVKDLEDVYVWIAGEGPERENLEKLRAELGLEDRVKFLGWRNDRAALLQAADICVFASRYEPFGTVFAQAWAQATPVIVSDADGPRQFVRHEEDGLVVPVENPEALADAIRRMRADKALPARCVQNGLKRYQGEFTAEKSLQSYLDYYREILGQDP